MNTLIKSKFPALWSLLKRIRQRLLSLRSSKRVFRKIYQENTWGDLESKSGPGSNLESTKVVREFLPGFLRSVEAKSILDLPCGDLHWMRTLELGTIKYIGADVVPEIIEKNRKELACGNREFWILDLLKDELPKADVLLCRDCFIHLSNSMVRSAIDRICQSRFEYLITTTFVEVESNLDIELGGFRAINLLLPPFNLPEPMILHREGGHQGKSIAVWKISEIQHSRSR